jgi:chromosome segregation ATPase
MNDEFKNREQLLAEVLQLNSRINALHKQVKNLSLLLRKMANRNQRLEDEIKNLSEAIDILPVNVRGRTFIRTL